MTVQTKTKQRDQRVKDLRLPSKPELRNLTQENKDILEKCQDTVATDKNFYGLNSNEIDAEAKQQIREGLSAALAVREFSDVPAGFRAIRKCVTFVGERRCNRPPINGSFACAAHIDQISFAESQRRLVFLIDPALQTVFEILTSEFSKDDTRLRAARIILDRTLPVQSKQEIEVTRKKGDLSALSNEQLLDKMDVARAQLFALAERKKLAAEFEKDIVDAEVVSKEKEEENVEVETTNSKV